MGSSSEVPTDKPRILLVDDDVSVRAAFARVLTREGFDVTQAADGSAALEAMAAALFNVIVTDIAMPGLDGLQLLREVRELDLDVPVVLMTGAP